MHVAVQIWYREDEIMLLKNVILRIPTNKLYEVREIKKKVYKKRNEHIYKGMFVIIYPRYCSPLA